MKKEVDLTTLDLKASILHIAVPMMAGGLLINTFSVVDLFFVGRLGHIAMAGLGVSVMILTIIAVCTTGVTTGTIALIAHFTGKKDYESANQTLWQTIILSLFAWLVFIVMGLLWTEPILKLFGAEGEVLQTAKPYLRISFLSSGFLFLHISLNQSLRGAGDAKTPLYVLILINIINLILDPLLIFGIGIFPRMEVAGSALTTAISRFIGFATISLILLRKKDGLNLSLHHFGIRPVLMKRILNIGFFSSMQMLLGNFALLLLTRLVTSFGPEAIAVYGLGTKIRMLLVVPGFGFANATGILMGQNMGADKEKRAEDTMLLAVKMFQILLLPVAIIIFLFSPWVIGMFNANETVISTGSVFLRYIMFSFPFLGISMILRRGMMGVGDTAVPSGISAFFSLLVLVPLAYLLAHNTALGVTGVWLSICVADILLCFSLIGYFQTARWKKVYFYHRNIVEENSA